MESEYQYDLFVIGGGSGGLASSKEAADLGLRVGLADFVKPSPQGTAWGLGGTCVNVGCIPKKLMHHAALYGELRHDQEAAGWTVNNNTPHDWDKMREAVQTYIHRQNWGYRFALNSKKVKYYNKLAKLIDNHTIELTDAKGNKETITTQNILIVVGGRPIYPDLPNAKELMITSDDLFSLKQAPGKTLIIGASYVALECGGFLTGLGHDVTILVRSILLRGYDQDIANRIGKYMEDHGTKLIRGVLPESIEKTPEGKIRVVWSGPEGKAEGVFDTVISAIGRSADTKLLNVEAVGVRLASNGKIVVADDDKTTVENIYSIGDCAEGRPEFTPTAILAGRMLARRLAGKDTRLMDYRMFPATVFTPLEYGCIGYSEEDAIKEFGDENIDIYHSHFKPLEWSYYDKREDYACYGKLVVRKTDNHVIGFHYLGPNAGEVTQGFAISFRKGVTKEDFDYTVMIHPTNAEEMFQFTKTKREDPEAKKQGCCG